MRYILLSHRGEYDNFSAILKIPKGVSLRVRTIRDANNIFVRQFAFLLDKY